MSKKSTDIGVGKKVLASALSAAMVVAFAPAVAMAGEPGDNSNTLSVSENDSDDAPAGKAMIGNESYDTLVAAVNAVENGQTITLTGDMTGSGVKVAGGKNFTVDFGGYSYTVLKPAVGSVGTETNGFQLIKGSTVVFKNGTLRSNGQDGAGATGDPAQILIQNYSNLTLTDMVLDGAGLAGDTPYALSNNYGKVLINGNSSIYANEKGYAFDVYYWPSHGDGNIYVDGAQVTVDTTGTIDGVVQYGTDSSSQAKQNVSTKSLLTIKNGVFTKKIDTYGLSDEGLTGISIDGGTFTDIADAVKYAADNATLKMGADATASLTIPAGKNITLDLNGKALTNTAGQHTITNNGTLTVKGEGTVDNVSHGKAAVYNATTGAVTLEGGTYNRSKENGNNKSDNGGNSFYTLKNFGQMTIKDGVVVKQGENEAGGQYSSMVANGWQDASTAGNSSKEPALRDGGAVLTIDGGTFSGGLNTVKNDDNGVLTINGGTFKNYSQMAFQNHNVATVTGGTFEGANGASAIENCGTDCGPVSGTLYDKHKLTISGGVFNGKLVSNVEGGSVGISGGVFSVDPAAYLADGSVVYKKHSGTDGYSYIVQASGAARPANSSGYNYWTSADGKTYTEGYSAPVTPTPAPDPEPTPTPEPAAPGTNVSGTDAAGNAVEATVTDNNKTTLPDGTEAAGSVEYKGTASSGSEPASSAEIPASVTSSDGTVYAVTKIADDAFNGQGQLKSVSIPATVVEIGARAFAGTGIESVELPAATSTLGAGAFQGCASLKTADISSAALTQIPADAFNGAAITSIDIPGSVKSVGARAFKGTQLKGVSTQAKTIAKSAFAGCESLKTVSLPEATEVGAYALSGTALKSVSLPKAESIGAGAFKDAAKLKALATGSVLEELGPKALSGTKVKTLTIRSKRLTKSGVKGSLKGSAVTKVEVAVTGSKKTQDKYVKRYSKFFAKANSGKSVEVTKAKKAAKK